MIYIYGLKDPRNNEIRYVGKSINPTLRYSEHIHEKKTNKEKMEWLKDLSDNGAKPELVILETIGEDVDWQEREKYWIAFGYESNWRLTNIASGGKA